MKTDSRSILLVTGLIVFLPVCVGDRFFIKIIRKQLKILEVISLKILIIMDTANLMKL